MYFPLNGSVGSMGAVLNLYSVPVLNTSSLSHIILAGTYSCTSATRTNAVNNTILLFICLSLFQHRVICSKKACADRQEKDSSTDKTEVCIKKPANHQCGYDQQSVIQYAQMVLPCTISDGQNSDGKDIKVNEYHRKGR